MGCFSMQCAISGLPIHAGDDIRYLLLQESHNERSHCYISSQWTPFVFPIKAKYNDYGSIEDYKEDFQVKLWQQVLAECVVEKPVGENKYHDLAISKDMSFVDLLRAIWEERVEVKTPWGDRALAQAMIREDVWQLLLSRKLENAWIPGVPGSTDLTVDDYRKDAVKALDFYKKNYLAPLPVDLDGRAEAVFRRFGGLTKSDSFIYDKILGQWRACHDDGRGPGDSVAAFAKGKHSEKQAAEFLGVVGETLFVEAVASELRYWWRPSYTCGPQRSNWKDHTWYAKGILEISKKEKKAQDEY